MGTSETRTRTALFVASALVVGGLAVFVVGGPNRADAVPATEAGPVDLAGTGETLVLVVGEVLGTFEEAEAAMRDRLTLGELDGFHAVPASDFRLEGAYVRSAPRPLSCEEMESPADRTACGDRRDLVTPHIELRRTPLAGLASAHAGGCAATLESVELPLCFDVTAAELRDVFGDPDAWLAVAAFRTLRGTTDFLGTVQALRGPDFAGDLVVLRATRVAGDSTIGLGQEPHPAGSGPLVAELPDQDLYQTG